MTTTVRAILRSTAGDEAHTEQVVTVPIGGEILLPVRCVDSHGVGWQVWVQWGPVPVYPALASLEDPFEPFTDAELAHELARRISDREERDTEWDDQEPAVDDVPVAGARL